MSRRVAILILVMFCVVLLVATLSRPVSGVAVHLVFAGQADVRDSDQHGTFTAAGHESASPFGAASLTGRGDGRPSSAGYCALFTGSGRIVTGDGSLTLRLDEPAKACLSTTAGAGDRTLVLSGRVSIPAGTGVFAGRSGTLTLTGRYAVGTEQFTVSLRGRLG